MGASESAGPGASLSHPSAADDVSTPGGRTADAAAVPITPLDAARAYLDAGWLPIPVRPYGKNPEATDWPNLRLTRDDLPRYFRADTNVGILLGAASGGLVDVDIDHDSAKKLTRLLPPTGRVHGRPSNPDTHFWYRVQGVVEKTIAFKDPLTGEMLIELRSTGGQTVAPPSRYRLPDGTTETLYWAREGQAAAVDASELLAAVRRIAATALIGKHWPKKGSRNETTLALAGCLLRSGFRQAEAETLISLVCDVANDEEQEERIRCVASTREKLDRNEPVTGCTRLSDLIGEKIVATAMEWLKLDHDRERGWDAPIMFDDRQLPDLSPTLLPGPFGDFAAALALAAQIPTSMAVLAVVSAVSSCVTMRFVVSPKDGWIESINIYVIIALPPGNNKSLVKRECVSPIDDWEMWKRVAMDGEIQEAKSRRRNEETQIDSLRRQAAKVPDATKKKQLFAEVVQLELALTRIPVPPKAYVSDATPESLARNVSEQSGRLAVISDEGGVMEVLAGLYSGGRANMDIVLKGIDGGRVRIERKDTTIDVEPYLTMLLIVQPRILQNMASQRSFQGNGLFERFLYLIPQSRLGHRELDVPPIPDTVRKNYAQAVKALLDIPRQIDDPRFALERPRCIRLSPGAAAVWQQFRSEFEIQLRTGGRFEAVGAVGWAGKASGVCLRVAGLLQVMESGEASTEVSAENMTSAVTIMRVLSEHALAAYGSMQSDQASQDAEHVLSWIQEHRFSRFRRTECNRKFHGRFTTKKRFDAALAALIDRNIINPEREEMTTQGKRGTKYFEVNPALGGDREG